MTTLSIPQSGNLPKLHDPEFLIFIRHGQTDWNAEGRMQGQRDIPLNDIGRGQASGNGAKLKDFLREQGLTDSDLDFVSSPLGRTRSTMELLRSAMGLPPGHYRLDDRLKEITFGDWEGFTFDDLADEEQELIAARRADKWGFTPPNGESYRMLASRIGGWLKSVQTPTVVVSHGGVFRVLRGLLEGGATVDVPKLDVPQDKVFVWRNGGMTAI
ncbi:histidine phosphatase family protein [Roseibium denhamense]|uniref:Probable phosphoglycerate mutase n=1 Tax=Roseibium denhamense TaxID=76305 RepID=A0ABY1P422_9HYPH|nr:histidine phosphatase family protein [Roseibium denhamense]MTI05187.1 histidine phosphatase family protein [Roseibium denhamense]SMP25851.1 probable phosphoglycerate mutase [Roseibium denhamense]